MAKRIPKNITNPDDIAYLLSLKEEDFTLSTFMDLFGEFDGKQKFHPYDTFTVPKGAYGNTKKNTNAVTTTVGIWAFNRFVIEKELGDTLGYLNYEIDSGKWGKLVDIVTEKVLEDELELYVLDHLLQKSQKLMPLDDVLTPALTDKFLNVSKYIEPKKRELAKKYQKELEAGDAVTAEKMEKELIQYAMDYLGDDPSLDLYLSGARSSIGNHFKNMYIMKGAVRNPDPNAEKQFDIVLSNYNDGISKDEYSIMCNSLATGPYKRAAKTEVGGKWEKLFVKGLEHVVALPKGTDCGTKDTIDVILTEKEAPYWMYSNMVENGKLVELNSKNKDKYIGKKVKFRFSGLCECKNGICNACMGNLTYKLNVTNVGIVDSSIASILKNIQMKAFHDSTEKAYRMDVQKAFGE